MVPMLYVYLEGLCETWLKWSAVCTQDITNPVGWISESPNCGALHAPNFPWNTGTQQKINIHHCYRTHTYICSICSISSEWNTLTWDSSSFWTPSTLGNLADLPIPGGFSSTRQSSSRVWQHYYQTGTILCLVPSIGLFLSRASGFQGFQEVTWKIQNCNSHLLHLLQRYLFMHVCI